MLATHCVHFEAFEVLVPRFQQNGHPLRVLQGPQFAVTTMTTASTTNHILVEPHDTY